MFRVCKNVGRAVRYGTVPTVQYLQYCRVGLLTVCPADGPVRRGGRAREEQEQAPGVREDGEDLPLLGQPHLPLQAPRPSIRQTSGFQG